MNKKFEGKLAVIKKNSNNLLTCLIIAASISGFSVLGICCFFLKKRIINEKQSNPIGKLSSYLPIKIRSSLAKLYQLLPFERTKKIKKNTVKQKTIVSNELKSKEDDFRSKNCPKNKSTIRKSDIKLKKKKGKHYG